MNDDQMRTKIDQVLAAVDRKLERRRLGSVARTGVAVGLAAMVEACSKILPPDEAQPVYGVEVDAATRDAAADAGDPDVAVLYGFLDAGLPDVDGVDAASFDQPIYPPYSIPDAGLDELGVLYGIPDASVDDLASVDDARIGDLVVIYGVPDAGYTGDADVVDVAPIPPYGLPPDSGE